MIADVHLVDVPLARPSWVGTRRLVARTLVLLRIDSDGLIGWGEASPVPGWHRRPAVVAGDLQRWIAGGPAPAGFGRAAIDTALLDIEGQRTGRPVCALLAVAPQSSVPVNGLLDGGTVAELVARAAQIDGRFPAVKLKVGGHVPDDEIERIRVVRSMLGPATALRLDANRRWSLAEATQIVTAVADLDIDYVEEPVASLEDLAVLRGRAPVPVALDETLLDDATVAHVIDERLADVVVLKPVLLGPLAATVALAERAVDAGLGVVVTSALDGAVGTATALHVAAALPAPLRPCGLATSSFLVGDVATVPPVVDGAIALPDRPGLGLTVAISRSIRRAGGA